MNDTTKNETHEKLYEDYAAVVVRAVRLGAADAVIRAVRLGAADAVMSHQPSANPSYTLLRDAWSRFAGPVREWYALNEIMYVAAHLLIVSSSCTAYDITGAVDQARRVFIERNRAYGTANIATTGIDGIITRVGDKFARLSNEAVPGERVEDALIDIINYAAILMLLHEGRWPGQTNEQRVLLVKHGVFDNDIDAPKKPGDVGYDLRASRNIRIAPKSGPVYVPTGVKIKAPDNMWSRIVARSSTIRRGIIVGEGVIDNGYTGELLVACFNFSDELVEFRQGDRVAQLIFCPVLTPTIEFVDELPVTERGASGFGSTGG